MGKYLHELRHKREVRKAHELPWEVHSQAVVHAGVDLDSLWTRPGKFAIIRHPHATDVALLLEYLHRMPCPSELARCHETSSPGSNDSLHRMTSRCRGEIVCCNCGVVVASRIH